MHIIYIIHMIYLYISKTSFVFLHELYINVLWKNKYLGEMSWRNNCLVFDLYILTFIYKINNKYNIYIV